MSDYCFVVFICQVILDQQKQVVRVLWCGMIPLLTFHIQAIKEVLYLYEIWLMNYCFNGVKPVEVCHDGTLEQTVGPLLALWFH